MAIRTKSILLCIIQAAISLMNQSPWHPSSWEPVITTRHVYTFTIHINKTCHIYQVWFRWCRVSLPSSWKTVIMTSCHNYPVLLQLKTMTAFIMTNCHHVKPSSWEPVIMTNRHHDNRHKIHNTCHTYLWSRCWRASRPWRPSRSARHQQHQYLDHKICTTGRS